jgi:two-component system sensor histidine kinase DesK
MSADGRNNIGETGLPGRKAQAGLLLGPAPEVAGITTYQAASDFSDGVPMSAGTYEFNPSQRLARVILLTVLCGFGAVEVIDVLSGPGSPGRVTAVGISSVCVLLILQVFISSQAAVDWPMPRRVGMLLAQALVTYLPLLVLGSQWGGMAGWLGGSILLLVPGLIAWVLFTAVILSMLVGSLVAGLDAYSVAYLTVASLDIGLVVFGLSRLAQIISYLKATRTELAQLAVIRERVRIARDLHDLLGYSLSAITLKAELTRRLVNSNPAQARDELVELLDVARQALADVRMVASGYRNMSLSKEAAAVLPLLSTAGIAARVEIDCGPLDERVDTVLATVLREAVTNMLRHSTAQNCTVEASRAHDAVRLQVTNDGAPPSAASHREGGGLENLDLRLAAVGGKLSVSRHDGRFDVLATVAMPIPDNIAAEQTDA